MIKLSVKFTQAKQSLIRILAAVLLPMALLFSLQPVRSINAAANLNQNKGDYQNMNAMELTTAMQPGWNMGNTLDATGGENSWGNPLATKELIMAIREQGFKSIRIPITWDIFIGPAPEFVINESYMARVHEVIDWAIEADLIVMMNMHHDSHWLYDMPEKGDALITRYRAVWEQISESFKDYPQQLIFETINEPRFSDDWGLETEEFFAITDRLNNEAYEIIRASGGENKARKIVMETLVAGITESKVLRLKENILVKNDPNLIASVHYYGIWPFSVNVGGKTRFTDEVSEDIDKQMGLLNDLLVADGIPVILGEYGLLGFDQSVDVIQQGEKLKFFDYLVHTAEKNKVTTVLWDNGQHFERDLHYWRDPALHAVIMQAVGGRSSFTELDTIYLPMAVSEDVRLPLILNGNQLTTVADASGQVLTEGSDYQVDGETLVLNAGFLEALVDGSLGAEGGIVLSFNSGPDWPVRVVRIGDPHLIAKTAQSYEFLIPVVLEGDRVERIKAVSASGQTLSAQSWSPYLTYSEEYSVDYDEGLIRISAAILSNFAKGDIYFTVETWSGLELAYVLTLTKDGKYGVPGTVPATIEPNLSETETEASETIAETEVVATTEATVPAITEADEAPPSDSSDNGSRIGLMAAIGGGIALLTGALVYLIKRRRDQN